MFSIVIGTKAELIKMMPLMKELEKRKLNYTFIHTGQHDVTVLLKDLWLKKPDYILYKPPKLSSRFMVKMHKAILWSGTLSFKLAKLLKNKNFKFFIYHGDTLSSACAAAAGSILQGKRTWQNVHIEAGLRSFNIFDPFPEEISRRICDRFADVLFVPSKACLNSLNYKNKKVFVVGNTIVDSVHISLRIAKKRYKRPKEKFVLVNIHRYENIKSRANLKTIVKLINGLKQNVVWPMHDNTKKQLKRFGLFKFKENVKVTPLIPYTKFIWLLKYASYLITDGGSIQEESLVLRKPCILLRKRTERWEGLKTGINFLVGLDINKAIKTICYLESNIKNKQFKNPYGDKGVTQKIVKCLVNL